DEAPHPEVLACVQEALKRPSPVEDYDLRLHLFQHQAQPSRELPVPGIDVRTRPERRHEVIGLEAHVLDDFDRRRQREEHRPRPSLYSPGVREASAEMAEAGTIDVEEQDAWTHE